MDERSVLLQVGKQIRSGLGPVLELDRRDAEQQRGINVLRGQGLGADAFGVGGQRLGPGVVALDEGNGAGCDRDLGRRRGRRTFA